MNNLTRNFFEGWQAIDVQFQIFYWKYQACSKKPVPKYLQTVDTSYIRWSSGTWKLTSSLSLMDIWPKQIRRWGFTQTKKTKNKIHLWRYGICVIICMKKLPKQMLGLAMKSLADSRKFIEILNLSEQKDSYNIIEN